MAETVGGLSVPCVGVAKATWRAADTTAAVRRYFRCRKSANRAFFTAWYVNADRQESKHRERITRWRPYRLPGKRNTCRHGRAFSRRFLVASAAFSPAAVAPAFFRCERR